VAGGGVVFNRNINLRDKYNGAQSSEKGPSEICKKVELFGHIKILSRN
jgi:hypothetical protein